MCDQHRNFRLIWRLILCKNIDRQFKTIGELKPHLNPGSSEQIFFNRMCWVNYSTRPVSNFPACQQVLKPIFASENIPLMLALTDERILTVMTHEMIGCSWPLINYVQFIIKIIFD